MGPRPEGMSREASYSDDADCISRRRVNDPNFKNLLGCNRLLGMVERSEAMEITVNTDILIEQTRRQDALVCCLKRDSCCVLSNVQLVAINSRHKRPHSDARLIFRIEILYELLSRCARRNILDPECKRPVSKH